MRCDLFVAASSSVLCAITIGCSGELTTPGQGADGVDGAAASSAVFRPGIQQDLDAAGCTSASCHGGTIAPMPLVASPDDEDDWLGNYNQVKARAGTTSSSLLIDKATGAGAHVAALTAADPMMDRWLEWVATGSPYQGASGAPDAGPSSGSDASPGPDASPSLTWEDDIRPMLDARNCLDCHGTSGAYSLQTYSAALGFGTDNTPNVIPGDPSSVLILYCDQGHYDMPAADTLTVISWIVDWNARER